MYFLSIGSDVLNRLWPFILRVENYSEVESEYIKTDEWQIKNNGIQLELGWLHRTVRRQVQYTGLSSECNQQGATYFNWVHNFWILTVFMLTICDIIN